MNIRAIALSVLIVLLMTTAGDVLAQKASRPFTFALAQWNRTLGAADDYVNSSDQFPERSRDFRHRIGETRREASAAAASAAIEVAKRRGLLVALGPAPTDGDPAEKPEIAEQRASYEEDLVFYRARVSQADVVLARAAALEIAISGLARARLFLTLSEVNPLPLAPGTIAVAAPEFLKALRTLAATPAEWWRALPPEKQTPGIFLRFVMFLVFAFGISWVLRVAANRFFGLDSKIEDPTYARRLLGAVAEGVSRGIFPAVILAAILVRLTSAETPITGHFAAVLAALCEALILFVLAWALPRAVLAPNLPHWRLTVLTPRGASTLSYRITGLAAIVAIDSFLTSAAAEVSIASSMSSELVAFYDFIFYVVEAIGILLILQPRLWRVDAEAALKRERENSTESDGAAPAAQTGRARFWSVVHILFALVTSVAIGAVFLGFGQLGGYLIDNLIGTGLVGGGLYLFRGLLRESVAIALRSTIISRKLAIQHSARRLVKFWVRALLDIVILITGIFLIAPMWGMPEDDLSLWAATAFQGFSVGNVTISLLDFTVGVLVFIIVIVLSRAMQRALSERILPETQIDIGLQHSLTAGFGYIGFILAAMLGVAALGLDLSNIALIAGALSVGIGFGLQTIVSNFVAGLTLLIERPIKVGDWIVVGDQEGIVKRIQVRATEIETFQRNSVIVPNSAFLVNNVINRTHKDSVGRIELPVGVAYGSDTAKVEKILLRVASENSKVAKWPEPFVLFQNFGDSSLDFELRCYCQNVFDTIRGGSELRFAIDAAFREEGIEIPFPQRDIHIKGLEALLASGAASSDKSPSSDKPPFSGKIPASDQ